MAKLLRPSAAWLLTLVAAAQSIGQESQAGRDLAAIDPGDWPAYRRDGGLTGRSPLVGGLSEAPRLLWSVDLGGAVTNTEDARLADLNGDGRDELLRILPDKIICQALRGEQLWETPELANPRVTHIRDFAGDGAKGLLVDADTGVEHRRYLVSGATGRTVLLYTSRNVFGRAERLGKLLADVAGEQLCAWWSGDPVGRFGANSMRGFGYLWSFEDGLERPKLRFRTEEVGTIYAPLHLLADMDGDGHNDMVMISHEEVWVYDLASGEKKMQSSWGPQIRTYWAATAVESLHPGDPPALLMINPMIPGVQVVAIDGKEMVRQWKRVVGDLENQYQKKVQIDKGAPDPFVDLNGDGALEILAAVTNEHGDGRTHLVIFAASDGDRVYDAPGLAVLTVDDLDGRDPPEVIVQEGADLLRICHWTGSEFVDLWRGENVHPVIQSAPAEGKLSRAVGARTTGINMPLKRDAANDKLFQLRFPEGIFNCRCSGSSVQRVGPSAATKANNSQASSDADYQWDGAQLSVRSGESWKVAYKIPQRRKYLASPPLVGSLGTQRQVIVREYAGSFVSLASDGSNRRVLIENSPSQLGACLTDLDGDGQNELTAQVVDVAGRSAIVAVDENGADRLRIPASGAATELMLGPTGRLGRGRGRWVVTRERAKAANTRVVAYAGRTGEKLWMRDFLGPENAPSTTFVLHLPTAVCDVDQDGADDLIASSENWYEVISVRDNRTVTPTKTITAAVPGHWGAYATPMAVDLWRNGNLQVFHNNAYALTLLTELNAAPIWHYGLTRDTTHASKAGVADLDGDGALELTTTQKNGLLRTFDAAPLLEKCPTCPAEMELGKANHGGRVRWTFQLPPPLSDLTAVDVDADGRDELLVGAGDGRLYALQEMDGACQILWSIELGGAVGSPVVADLNGDLKPEILAATADGRLHCLEGPVWNDSPSRNR